MLRSVDASWRSLACDDGLGLFCGLNVMPKKSFLSEYSSRITPQKVATLLGAWHGALAGETILPGNPSTSTATPYPTSASIPSCSPIISPNAAVASRAS